MTIIRFISYFLIDIIIDSWSLSENIKRRILINLWLQLLTSAVSLVVGSYLIYLFLGFVESYGIFEGYLQYLLSISNGKLSEVGGKAIVHLILSICSISLILYSLILNLGKKHLVRVGILSHKKLEEINNSPVNGYLNNLYTLVLFWVGFVPLFAETFGSPKYTINLKSFVSVALGFAIPYSYITIKKIIY